VESGLSLNRVFGQSTIWSMNAHGDALEARHGGVDLALFGQEKGRCGLEWSVEKYKTGLRGGLTVLG